MIVKLKYLNFNLINLIYFLWKIETDRLTIFSSYKLQYYILKFKCESKNLIEEKM